MGLLWREVMCDAGGKAVLLARKTPAGRDLSILKKYSGPVETRYELSIDGKKPLKFASFDAAKQYCEGLL